MSDTHPVEKCVCGCDKFYHVDDMVKLLDTEEHESYWYIDHLSDEIHGLMEEERALL